MHEELDKNYHGSIIDLSSQRPLSWISAAASPEPHEAAVVDCQVVFGELVAHAWWDNIVRRS